MKKRYFLLGFLALVFLFLFLFPVKIGLWLQRKNMEFQGTQIKTLETSIGRLSYFEGGIGDTVFFLHDIFSDASVWVDVTKQLLPAYHIVALDLPAHGDSHPIIKDLTVSEMMKVINMVAEKIPAKHFTLVGNSFGGWLATLYAEEYPDKVDKLILVNSAGLKADYPKKFWVAKNNRDYSERLQKMYSKSYDLPPSFIISRFIKLQTNKQIEIYETLNNSNVFVDTILPNLQTDIYIIWGRPDGFFSKDYMIKLNKFADKKFYLDGGGHVPHFQKPQEFVKILREILSYEH